MRRYLITSGLFVLALPVITGSLMLFWPESRSVPPSRTASSKPFQTAVIANGPARVVAGDGEPLATLRRLALVKDAVVDGRADAHIEQDGLLRQAAEAIANAPVEAWSDQRNLRALIPYLLNAGSSPPVRRLLSAKAELGEDEKLVVAMLAFAEHRQDVTSRLEAIDPLALPRTVGAAIALAKGLALQSDPSKAVVQLRLAQLLVPGGAIEECAMSREIFLLLSQRQRREALARAARYVWRFGRSPYAGGLTTQLASGVLPELVADDSLQPDLIRYFAELPPASRSNLLYDLARESVFTGRFSAIGFLSGQTKAFSRTVANDARMPMYEAIVDAFGEDSEKATNALAAIPDEGLGSADRGLRDATLALAKKMREPPYDVSGGEQDGDAPPVALAARDALAQADELLSEMIQ